MSDPAPSEARLRAMAIELNEQRDTVVAARLRRAAFGLDVGDVVFTLAARDDEPHLLRFRDRRTGHFEFKAELLEAHVPVIDADRGRVEFSAVPINITDSPASVTRCAARAIRSPKSPSP